MCTTPCCACRQRDSSLTPGTLGEAQTLQKHHRRLKICPFCPDTVIRRHYCMHALALNRRDVAGSTPRTGWTVHGEYQQVPLQYCLFPVQVWSNENLGPPAPCVAQNLTNKPRESSMGCAASCNRTGMGQAGIQPRPPCPGPAAAQPEHSSMAHPYGNHLLFSQSQSN